MTMHKRHRRWPALVAFSFTAVVIDQNGDPVDHPECLTYFPTGSFKGFYCVSTGKDDVGPAHYLLRISSFDASVTTYPSQLPYRGVRAMVSLTRATGSEPSRSRSVK